MRRRFIKNRETVDEYFTIESLEDECVISLKAREGLNESLGLNVWYSINNSHWTYNNLSENPITLKKGYKVRFKYDSPIGTFVITKKCKILGSVMSLYFMDDFKDKTSLGSCKFPWLFKGCNTIVSVDKNFLPATTLSEGCYCGMFYGCTSLVEAPILPATILTYRCYEQMFYGCNNLNYIKMLATDIPSRGYLEDWVKGVSPTGTFIKNPDAEWDVRGVYGVPDGWTIKFDGEEDEEPTFEFPVYLNFDECEVILGMTVCTRYADEISIALHSYLQECCIKYGVNSGGYYILHEDKIKELGIEIYVENNLVDSIWLSGAGVEMFTRGEYSGSILQSDGLFIYES